MEQNEELEQIKRPARKRSYSDHSMVKLAYRFNKKKLEKENKNIFGKDISEFISIIDELVISLPNFLDYVNKYFSYLQTKISILIQQINANKNSSVLNIPSNENENNNAPNKKEENANKSDEEFEMLFNKFDSINDFDKFIIAKRKELANLLDESIIKELNDRFNNFKLEKNKLLIRFQNIINEIIKIKGNIDLVIDKSKKIEDLEMQKNSNEDLKILQDYLSAFEKEYSNLLLELKKLNQNTLNFIYEDLNKYFELSQKINEEIKEEINRIIIGHKNSCEDENKFFGDKIKISNKKLQKDIKQYILLNNDNGINESMKSKSLLSRIGDAMLIAPEYYFLFNNFDNDEEDKSNNKKDDDNYNKEHLSTLKKLFDDLRGQDVISDESLNKLFGILGDVSDKIKYRNLCLHFVRYINQKTKSGHLTYNNVENFIFANNMLSKICQNYPLKKIPADDHTKDEFEENFKYYQILDNIIRIGNVSHIGNKYMCSLLKNNDIMKDIKTFKFGFKSYLISEIKNCLDKLKKNVNPVQNVIDLFNNKINSSFNKTDFIKEIGFDNYIEEYKDLNNNEKINFNNKEFMKILHNSLKKYIIYMANYDIKHTILSKFIKSLNEYFPFLKDNYANFYLGYYKSSLNSIKTCLFRTKTDNIKILKKINQIKQVNSKEESPDINQNEISNIKKNKIFLRNILPFLEIQYKNELLHLSKELNMRQYYYENILSSKELSLEKRIKIWQIILLNKEANNVNYKEILKDLNEIEDSKVIMDDTKRTFLANKDKEKTQEIVKNILSCFISKNNYNIRYCQGMNFIVAFLYDLTDNEELSFILFKSLIENTNLKIIYDKKFELLNCYFYILDRLISFFLPLLKQKFDEIQMNIDCFVSAYFLTLFSNVFILNNNCKKFMIFILENFMLKGWKVIFKAILALLKYNKEDILNIKEEGELLNYVIQNLRKSDIFLDENFEKFLNLYNNFYVNTKLINDLKEEYILENEIKNDLNIKSEI